VKPGEAASTGAQHGITLWQFCIVVKGRSDRGGHVGGRLQGLVIERHLSRRPMPLERIGAFRGALPAGMTLRVTRPHGLAGHAFGPLVVAAARDPGTAGLDGECLPALQSLEAAARGQPSRRMST
jgi:hypothetical protein